MLKVDGVFAGGGMKAFAFVGALQALDKKEIYFDRLAGTSAGAIMATLIKVGYNSHEIAQIFEELELPALLDKKRFRVLYPFYRWLRLYAKMGFYQGDVFEEWLRQTLHAKGVYTFSDIEPGTLKMVASDLTNGNLLVIPDDLPNYGIEPENFSVARAVRMSCSLPFFFEPVKLKNNNGIESMIVDGGVLSNFPIWLFASRNQPRFKRPVLGFRLSPSEVYMEPREIKNALNMLYSMVDTMRTAHDQRYIEKHDAKNIVFIPADHISTTNFNITDEEKDQLIDLGEKSTLKFLKKWTY
ncbi:MULTISPECIES: patatin-like phospholipase family protein [Bacillaceae]|uniref:Patatin-like phospholipase family protein n=1 Tax=Evansella alkalicola TaxID=745819 RepID=A0ABS6K004_9BACI|nr:MULTISPECIES: patatin-like phospholipase family protein [Bacillaceae]MBU9724181.1 patatin-like phospholipase family protein [Bacillus alkalicola]